jgi:hypothetical protein
VVDSSAALLAAAIRAAILAKAPRRTVQAIAAAVTGVLVRPPTAAAAPNLDAREVPAGTSVDGIRSSRTAQRQRKKQRRRSAAAKATINATAMSAGVLQCDTVRAAAPEAEKLASESGDAQDVWKSKRRKKGYDGVKLGTGGSSGDGMATSGAEVLQRDAVCASALLDVTGSEVLQRKAVRAAEPMDVSEVEVLDDYWADEGMPQAAVMATVAVRTDAPTREDAMAMREGALRRKKILTIVEALRAQVKFHAEAKPSLGSANQWAVKNSARMKVAEDLLALTDMQLVDLGWPPPGL